MRRRMLLMAAIFIVVVLIAVGVIMSATPMFTATSSVMIDTRKEQVVNNAAVLSGLSTDTSAVDTEVQVLQSRQLAGRVSQALHLDQDPEFNPNLPNPQDDGPLAAVKSSVVKLKTMVLGAGAPKSHQVSDQVIDSMLQDLSVKRANLTYVINISFSSQSAQKASQIANAFADLYLKQQIADKTGATDQATAWLNQRLGELSPQVKADDAAVQNYRVNNNLMSTNATSLAEQEISDQTVQLSAARAQAAEDQARLDTAKAQLAAGQEVGAASSSEVVRTLRSQRAELSANVASLAGRYGPKNPELQTAQRQLTDLDANIKLEVDRVISSLQAQADASAQRLDAVQKAVANSRGSLASSNRAMVRFNDLQRTADASKNLYESYLNRYQETSSTQGIQTADASLISAAKTPNKPSSPNKPIGLALGMALGLLAALAGLVIAENLDAGLVTSDDVERRLKIRYLAGIPSLQSVTKKRGVSGPNYLLENPLSSYAESFRNLRASIQFAQAGGTPQVVALTSALPGEGKTMASICLARSAALQGARVVVVDCDLRRHVLEGVLQLDAQLGLVEVLTGAATLDQVLVADKSGAMILPLSKVSFGGKDLFGSDAMTALLAELRKRFDLIILDTAPVLPVVDTRVLAGQADAVVFLVKWRKTPEPAARAALKILSQTEAKIVGAALTQVDMRKQIKFAYGDPDFYYRQYKGYYAAES